MFRNLSFVGITEPAPTVTYPLVAAFYLVLPHSPHGSAQWTGSCRRTFSFVKANELVTKQSPFLKTLLHSSPSPIHSTPGKVEAERFPKNPREFTQRNFFNSEPTAK